MFKSLTIIFLISISLLLTGCGEDQYAMERHYWRLQKQAEKIFKNPQASPPNELIRVVQLFTDFANKQSASSLAVDAEFTVARLYMVKENYDSARAKLKRMLDKYSRFESICSEALFMMGNTYELENKWSLALEQYQRIMREYPATRRGIDIPIYIAEYYRAKYQPEKMVAAIQEAIVHYRSLAVRFPNTPIAFTASTLVGECFLALKDWQAAVDTLDNVVNTYKDKAVVDSILLNMALIYQRELKNEPKAREILERLIKEYPKSAPAKKAAALLSEWSKK
jgi:TolA-binding protein